jgi:hypothetical protein
MSVKDFKFVSPGVFINEIDNSFRPKQPDAIGPVIIGRSEKGIAMTPTKVESYRDFVDQFGETVPGKSGGDIYRNGTSVSPMYGTYAAKAFLRSGTAPITYLRLLGQQSKDAADTVAGKGGWKTANQGNAGSGGKGGGAYGLWICQSSSLTTKDAAAAALGRNNTGSFHLGAIIYADQGVPLLKGTVFGSDENAAGNQTTTSSLGAFILSDAAGNFEVAFANPVTTTPFKSLSFNLNESSQNFIRKKLNVNPTLVSAGDFYDSSAELDYWVGETFEQYIASQITASSQLIGLMLPMGNAFTATESPAIMQLASREGHTGWIISQDTGDPTAFEPYNPQKLFRLVGRGHGEWLHKNCKVSIERIKASNSTTTDYGTFSVVIRALNDTDVDQQILERFDNLNLDPTSPNYIKKQIGDIYYEYDESNRRLREYGDYPNMSKYVYVELHSSMEGGGTPGLVPFGYYGPPSYQTISISSSGTDVVANGELDTVIGLAPIGSADNVYGGCDGSGAQSLTGGVMGRLLAHLSGPTDCLVHADTDASTTDRTDVYYGMRTSRTSTSHNPAYGISDMHRMLTSEQASPPGATNGKTTSFAYIFTMDDIVSGSNEFTWISGSRKGVGSTTTPTGYSLTATASNDYKTLLDFGYDQFTLPFFGGFDGFDIKHPDPLYNGGLGASSAASSEYFTYRQALETVADPEQLDFNLLVVPGLTNTSLTQYMIDLCEERRDALALIDLPSVYTPFAESYMDANARANRNVQNTANDLKTRRIDSSYGCCFYPWVQTRDANTGQSLWVPPSVAMCGVLASSEASSAIWFAPAGFNRGGLTDGAAGIPITNVSQKLSAKERDTLYDSRINPIASFPSSGIVVMGQKTLQERPSALDRINVRRLVIYLKKQISILSTQILFEQNVQATWDRFKGLIEPFLANVKTKFGITEYRLILDETTTTPDLIDQNIMYAKIMIKPARAIEFIAIDFIIASTGASFDD